MVKITQRLLLLGIAMAAFCSMAQAQQKKGRLARSVDVSVSYDADFFANIHGGLARGIRYLDDLDLDLTMDLNMLLGWSGATLYLYGIGNQGGSISALAGDFQGVNNIEAGNSWRLYEAWIQKIFSQKRFSILVGLYDLNSEFDVINSALTFINSSQGMGAAFGNSGVMGPSTFPYTSPGVRLKINPVDGFVVKAAAMDGIPSDPNNPRGTKILFNKKDGLLLAAEASYNAVSTKNAGTRSAETRLQYILGRTTGDLKKIRISVGAWLYTHRRTGWMDKSGRDRGLYASSEFRLYREYLHPFEGLLGFVRVGISNEKINRLQGYVGGGLAYTGLIDGRPDDKTGIAVAHAINSSDYRETMASSTQRAETNIEGMYTARLAEWIQFQGDLQYVVHPNMDPSIKNAFIVGVRSLFYF